MFAMMGMCTKGELTVVDDDQIEVSNLNRQFLFRKKHVKMNKSETAAKVVKKFNPEFNVIPVVNRL